MFRTEVLKEWFFPIPALRRGGMIVPAPEEAVEKYRDLKDDWLIPHPKLPYEVPRVSLSSGKEQGQEGYFVRTEVMYR